MYECDCGMQYKVVIGLLAHQARHRGNIYIAPLPAKKSLWRRWLHV